MNNIKITFKLTQKQREVWEAFRRFNLWRAGRRGSKTRFAVYKQGRFAATHANTVNWYVAQETSLLEDEIIPLFMRIFGALVVDDKTKGHNKHVVLYNGSKVFFKSANSNNSLRGRGIHSLVCEEAVFWQNGHVTYHETLRPQLADFKGWCLIISSPPSKKCPKGSEWFRRLEQQYLAMIKAGNTDYAVFHSTIYDNPYIDRDEIESIKATADPETWQVEYMAEYNDKVGQVYWEFDPLEYTRDIAPDTNIIMRVRGLDWGLGDDTGCAYIALLPDNKLHIYDEHVENNLDVPEQATRIKAKTLNPVAWTVLDSSCWNRLPGVESVAIRFAQSGIPVMPGTKDFDGSTSDMKVMFSNGNITISPKCVNILQGIREWQWGQHEPDVLAGLRYGVNGLIRAGKVLRPVRAEKPSFQNHIQQLDELDKRRASMEISMKRKSNGTLPRFKFYNM